MLAAHLQRLARREPVRYAHALDDPALRQALQNYIRLHLRAGDFGSSQVYATGDPQYHELHQTPQATGAWNAMMEEGHPVDLAAYLDLMREGGLHGPTPTSERRPSDILLRRLGAMQQDINMRIAEPMHGEIPAFSNAVVFGQPLRERLLRDLGTGQRQLANMRNLNSILGRASHPRHFHIASLLNDIQHGGDVNSLMRMYDAAHELAAGHRDSPTHAPMENRAAGARTGASELLNMSVLANLGDYTREGRFRQS